ncbi:flagellar hook assembly protein FlgD [Ideonella paludis]|uniref:Basal-body rod modification protein FlgD n=1 Tax=Ideonella paludis TaxID=1233411 RepID=A0ABS5DYS0_9BURK|nr:flagellar hook capping FlgD N-terminal domain-containing protein [Ideonella paludis]MBQ0936209.1 flagellar hook assembly protein FlgD [Ideonella paludis]
MTSVTSTTGTSSTQTNALAGGSPSATEQSDRFLKLLVTQMQNQDPLNPLDNAQVTSQMAQISTVSGLENLNTSLGGLSTQFGQLQALQAAALVGHDVAFEGNSLRVQGTKADAGFELKSKADKVVIDITTPGGTTVDRIEMSALDAGRHDINWEVPSAWTGTALNFKVTATANGKPVESLALEHQRVTAVSNFAGTVAFELANGERLAHDAVWTYL